MSAKHLVPTAEAAKSLGIHRATLTRWRRKGMVKPAFVTTGGQARWDVEELRRQIAEQYGDE